MDLRLGIRRPDTPPFSLNNAVDALLKKEFDIHRKERTPHPLMEKYGLEAVPFEHKQMNEWRDALRGGVRYHDKETNLVFRGGIDDVWVDPDGNLIVVDYKATSKADPDAVISIDADWQIAYKRQIEVYQWLFKQNGFKVLPVGYFVYVNGRQDRKAFDGKLEFDVTLIPYEGNTDWIPGTLKEAKKCLLAETIPAPSDTCQYCAYRKAAAAADAKQRKK